jgi:hypothetical protein
MLHNEALNLSDTGKRCLIMRAGLLISLVPYDHEWT